MPGKVDRRRARERRQHGAIMALYRRGLDVETVARRVRVPTRRVEKVLEGTGIKAMTNVLIDSELQGKERRGWIT